MQLSEEVMQEKKALCLSVRTENSLTQENCSAVLGSLVMLNSHSCDGIFSLNLTAIIIKYSYDTFFSFPITRLLPRDTVEKDYVSTEQTRILFQRFYKTQ